MSEKAVLGGARGVAAVAGVAAAGLAVFLGLRFKDDIPLPAVLTPGVDAVRTEDENGQPPRQQTSLPSAPARDPASDAGESAAAPDPAGTGADVPVFDHVRVDPDGRAVIAGTAPSGYSVSVEVDGAGVGSAEADETGHFAMLLDLPLSGDAQVISLIARGGKGEEVRSEDSVILAPSGGGQVARASGAAETGAVSEETAEETAGETSVAEARGGQAAGPLVTERTESREWTRPGDLPPAEHVPSSPGEALAPSVLLAGKDGVELLQPANATPAPLLDRVVVDVISYSDDGSVALEGRAATKFDRADRVQVYLNNRPVQSARVAPDGTWKMRLPPVKPGVYTLRVDQVAADGRVVARFETPFKREDPAALARIAALGGDAGAISASVITVQPGYTLWGIATDRYGSGMEYVQIFEANKGQIRDPDLIYPGQVFELPEGAAEETAPE